MVRRVLKAIQDPTKVDDKDYYGNKRLECAGQLMSLLFEDLFKKLNAELKKEVDKLLPKLKGKKEDYFDITRLLHTESITTGNHLLIVITNSKKYIRVSKCFIKWKLVIKAIQNGKSRRHSSFIKTNIHWCLGNDD